MLEYVHLHRSNNLMTTIYTVFSVILDIFTVLVKFWYYAFYGIYDAFAAEEKSVAGEIVLVTGAGHGIGKQLSIQYSELGATVVCWDINEQLNLDTVNLIKSKGRKAFGYT